ncbi:MULTISPECIES: hypothetical protein [Mesonia]|uniref:Uncharacterized protein n=1 Tax=Mesonia oceanica TaxID=2687242 RepID=A0AC61Y3S0_9FLAO|nr:MULTISPECIES: hypothetical protein [Mesonia]MAN26884.1 hypothetical protein [Mesonia sp.]MAQ41704.1 hypothetical protein [Mesonia sp.]MBJ96556.1 hypothetical protein [Flavobacteriaceae bacterium]VVU99118.1 hypothetical protein FVB9532_00370 [Mesonia oceanica]|tara:strand:+ start:3869 stop:4750 length:882 start_codon:yes stop_codon:yes gene_type:complete
MSEKKKENILKILIGVLLAGLVIMLVYTFSFHSEKNENIKFLEEEKVFLQKELEGIQRAYDSLELDNASLKQNLKKEQQRISQLIDSIEQMEQDYFQLKKYRLQADQLKMEKQRLLSHIHKLSKENEKLKTAIDSTNQILQTTQKKTDSIYQKNEELQQKINEASIIKLSNIQGQGVTVKNDGEINIINKASRIEKIRVCFTINESKLAEEGEKQLYIQVINPKNNLIGEKKKKKFNEKELYYSAMAVINYHKIDTDACALINIAKEKAVEGKYIVHVFQDDILLASETFMLD